MKRYVISVITTIVFLVGFPGVLVADSFDTSSSSSLFSTLLDFASGMENLYEDIDSRENVRNINNQDGDELVVQAVRYYNYESSENDIISDISTLIDESDIAAAIVGTPLVYPNPFRQSLDDGAELHYTLSKDLDIQIHLYNMMAHLVFRQSFEAGSYGAKRGPNVLEIDNGSLNGYILSAGVYFFVIVYDGEVLHKGKMVVKP